MHIRSAALLLATLLAPSARAAILRVPEDHRTIGEALAAAAPGDVISVAPGTYSARTGEAFPLVFSGRTVVLEGVDPTRCTLDGESRTRILEFRDGDASIVRGLRLSGGATAGTGGAVRILDASPEIALVWFSGSRATRGGDAVSIDGGRPLLRNCLFTGHDGDGGTIAVDRGAPRIELCTLHGNVGAGFTLGPDAEAAIRGTVVSRPGEGRGPSVGFVLAGEGKGDGRPTLERNLFAECRDGVYWIDSPPRDAIVAAIDEARRRDGLREGEPLDERLRPRGARSAELGAFGGADPLPELTLGVVAQPAETDTSRSLLGPAVPNPFHPETTIHFQVPDPSVVDLGVYNVLGQRIRTLLAGDLPAGEHSATWDGRDELGVDAPPGIYFVRITQGRRPPESRRIVLVR
jgi:hypothetical protein